jgi:hypothetical protein
VTLPALVRGHRWVWLAGVVGLVAFAAVYGPWSQPSAQVRTIVAGLRSSAVYQAPGAPSLMNAARARQVIGNRPIVLAILDRTPLPADDDDEPRQALCQQIARQVPGDYVWVYAADSDGRYDGDNCYGPKFPHPTKAGVGMDDFDLILNEDAQLAAQYRITGTNLTPQIEEFVLAFDNDAATDYGAIPTRSGVPDELAGRQIVLAGAAMVLGTVTLFLLLRFGAVALNRRSAANATLRRRHTELNTQLNSVADAVINPRRPRDAKDAQRQADVAKRYVLALDQLSGARTDKELSAAQRTITALTTEVGR